MEVLAVAKGVRMSPQKVREMTRQIQGMHAMEASAADSGLLVREHRDDGGAKVVAHLGQVLRLRLLLLVTT